MSMDRVTRNEIEKEARKVVPFLEGKKSFTALLDCVSFFSEYGWSFAKANAKTDDARTIRKEIAVFFNSLSSGAFVVQADQVADMHCALRKDERGKVIQAMVFAPMFIAQRIVCYLELFGVNEDYQRKNIGRQAVYQLSDFLHSSVGGKCTGVFGIFIIVPLSKVTNPHGFYKKLGFEKDLPFGFECWTKYGYDMMHLPVKESTKDEAVIRLADLISSTPAVNAINTLASKALVGKNLSTK
jgi:GNAT superfamily N-acetyltransferase